MLTAERFLAPSAAAVASIPWSRKRTAPDTNHSDEEPDMADQYSTIAPTLTSPALDAAAVIPNDTNDLPNISRALYVGGAGDIAVEMMSGASVTLRAVPGGALVPLRARRVLSAGTTATNIVAMW